MMKTFVKNFITCGIAGWCLEILFTSLHSLQKRQFTLKGHTSIWMFPIYGCASFLLPLFKLLKNAPFYLRGSIYAVCIFIGEYISGRLLSLKGLCPWNYRNSRWHIREVIRLDYFFNWFAAGLFFERLLASPHQNFAHGERIGNP